MHNSKLDYSSLLLSDQLLLRVFSKLPISHLVSTSLVCKRWLFLHGRLVQSLKLLDWHFLESGRLFAPSLLSPKSIPSLVHVSGSRQTQVSCCPLNPPPSSLFLSAAALVVPIMMTCLPTGFTKDSLDCPKVSQFEENCCVWRERIRPGHPLRHVS
ncbi:unnamed protein product [Brassica napus]|uniref:(rape) hypothetical protein n=1 Tax=Brassica napus TaxID=3708 RepID=A0A816NDY8_BRANA|nr:unnamed protein product [Brassica napus]